MEEHYYGETRQCQDYEYGRAKANKKQMRSLMQYIMMLHEWYLVVTLKVRDGYATLETKRNTKVKIHYFREAFEQMIYVKL